MDIYYFTTKDENNLFQIQSEQKVSYITFDTCYSSKSRTLKMPDQLKVTTSDALCIIPTIIDQTNAYTYDGVELALRCYFDFFNRGLKKFWFLLTGIEHESSFWKHCKYSNILKLPNVRYVYNNRLEIERFLGRFSPNLDIDWNECKENVKTISIDRPASYQSSHSVTNEWSIYRWSKQLGIDNIAIDNEIDDLLYFNYLKTIFHETDIKNTNNFVLSTKGKVLLIDDEVGKGWGKFFDCFCKELTFSSIGEDFKKATSQQEIIDIAAEKVEGFDPDVVILDLRLMDNDFEDTILPEQLTGAMIFNKIKEINRGIQVIIFSASNKIWNYYHIDHDGIILKESPEKSAIENYTEKCIDALISSIDRGIARGHWLKKVYACIAKISDLIFQSLLFQDKKDEILGNLNVAFDLLSKNNYEVNPKYLAYSYLQLYIVVEKFLQEDSIYHEIGREAVAFGRYIVARWASIDKLTICDYAINNGPKYRLGLNLHESRKKWWKDTHFKMSSVLLFGYGVRNTGNHPWYNIKDVRNNKAGHPETGDVTQRELETLLDFMIFIFDENNRQYVPMDYSLPRISSAIVTLVGKECQAKLNDTDANLPLQFDNKKPKLKIGDNIEVEVVVNKGKPIALHYITT